MQDATADQASERTVTAASDIEVDREALDASIAEFVEKNPDYYQRAFHRIFEATGPIPKTFNVAAAALGPIWAGMRGVWGFFWAFLILEMLAWVQIGRGLWGNPGADLIDRAEAQQTRAAERSMAEAEALNAEAFSILLIGIGLFVVFKLVQGPYANVAYEKQYSRWRIDPASTESGKKQSNVILGVVLTLAIAPLIIYKFTVANSLAFLDEFPETWVSSLFLM